MILLLNDEHRNDPNIKTKLINLEFIVVQSLQFDLQVQTVLHFVGRYLRFYDLWNTEKNRLSEQVEYAALQFCKFMQRKADFLNFLPAHQAAASYILAINLSKSPVADHVGLKKIDFEREAP